jgi:hypothetical protein
MVREVNFVPVARRPREPVLTRPVFTGAMRCKHQGFHSITSSYDRRTRTLIYFRRCDECGARLAEVERLAYEPRFDPRGYDRPLSVSDRPFDHLSSIPSPPVADGARAER